MSDYLQGVFDGASINADRDKRLDIEIFSDLVKIWDRLSISAQEKLAEVFLDA